MADHLTERDHLTLHVVALIEGTTVAEQRRCALSAYAAQARESAPVAEIVGLILASKRARERRERPNVIRLGGRHD